MCFRRFNRSESTSFSCRNTLLSHIQQLGKFQYFLANIYYLTIKKDSSRFQKVIRSAFVNRLGYSIKYILYKSFHIYIKFSIYYFTDSCIAGDTCPFDTPFLTTVVHVIPSNLEIMAVEHRKSNVALIIQLFTNGEEMCFCVKITDKFIR